MLEREGLYSHKYGYNDVTISVSKSARVPSDHKKQLSCPSARQFFMTQTSGTKKELMKEVT